MAQLKRNLFLRAKSWKKERKRKKRKQNQLAIPIHFST
jgi:hypothetical protein